MKTNTITAVPKLRFPEFSEDKSWQVEPLIKCASFINKKIELSKLNLTNYISTENILSDFEGVTKASKLPKTGKATHFIEEDILISNIRPYLRKVWFSDFIGGASNDVLIVRAKNEVNSKYLSFYLMTDRFINYVMTGAKGVKMPRGDISQIKKYDITYPSIKEQQKIADCLASLDDSINAEIQQLDTLKDHKAGLLQNLFPVGEETVPRYRFAEFEGDWEAVRLVDVAKTSIGLVTTMTTSYVEEGIPLIRNSDIKPNAIRVTKLINLSKEFADRYESKKLLRNDIVTVHTGDIGVSAMVGKDLEGSLGFATLNTRVTSPNICAEFVCLYFNSPEYKKFALSMSTGDGRNNFNLKDFNKTSFYIPSVDEQQKIAECLSSLDNLIESQDNKVAALKQHKQGLMQQLFPVMDEK